MQVVSSIDRSNYGGPFAFRSVVHRAACGRVQIAAKLVECSGTSATERDCPCRGRKVFSIIYYHITIDRRIDTNSAGITGDHRRPCQSYNEGKAARTSIVECVAGISRGNIVVSLYSCVSREETDRTGREIIPAQSTIARSKGTR